MRGVAGVSGRQGSYEKMARLYRRSSNNSVPGIAQTHLKCSSIWEHKNKLPALFVKYSGESSQPFP
jgi:hypothetical protein